MAPVARTDGIGTYFHRTGSFLPYLQDILLQEGMVWVDEQDQELTYYFPSMYSEQFE